MLHRQESAKPMSWMHPGPAWDCQCGVWKNATILMATTAAASQHSSPRDLEVEDFPPLSRPPGIFGMFTGQFSERHMGGAKSTFSWPFSTRSDGFAN